MTNTNRYFAVEIIVLSFHSNVIHIPQIYRPIAYTLKENSIFRHFAFPFIKPKHRRRTSNVSLYDENPFAK